MKGKETAEPLAQRQSRARNTRLSARSARTQSSSSGTVAASPPPTGGHRPSPQIDANSDARGAEVFGLGSERNLKRAASLEAPPRSHGSFLVVGFFPGPGFLLRPNLIRRLALDHGAGFLRGDIQFLKQAMQVRAADVQLAGRSEPVPGMSPKSGQNQFAPETIYRFMERASRNFRRNCKRLKFGR